MTTTQKILLARVVASTIILGAYAYGTYATNKLDKKIAEGYDAINEPLPNLYVVPSYVVK